MHPTKSKAQLEYIAKDAHEAAVAMLGHDLVAEKKYLEQVADAATVLHHRATNRSK